VFEGGFVVVPEQLWEIEDGHAQRRSTLDFLQEQLLLLAFDLDWPTEPLLAAYQFCLDRDLHLSYVGPRKLSPKRDRACWLEVDYDFNGDPWLRVAFTLSDGTATWRHSQVHYTRVGELSQTRLKGAFHWVGNDTVRVWPWLNPGQLPQEFVDVTAGGRNN
jgi:hypothetical protein